MADPRFFRNAGPFDLAMLAECGVCTLSEGADPALKIKDVAPLDKAGKGEISFFDNRKYLDSFKATKAAACIVAPEMVRHAPQDLVLLISKTPYKSYAKIAQAFYPARQPVAKISERANIAATAVIGEGCEISPGVYIGEGAYIGQKSIIGPNSVIGENVSVGDGCTIGANVSISHALIGNHVTIYRGACIGQDGFGFAIDPAGHVKVPQLGRVIIEDGVEIGANSCIDRGAGPDTVIGAGTWIDNLVQIGHNVKIGRGCVLVSQVGVSGSTELADFVAMGGQSGAAGHLKIGMGAQIGAKSGVMNDIEAGQTVLGAPAIPAKQYMRQVATLSRLSERKNKDSKE